MPRRLRSGKHPEYIQLQPYRALVGGSVDGRRAGALQGFIVGMVKGILWSAVPVLLLLIAVVYLRQGTQSILGVLAEYGATAAVLIGVIALISGGIAAARR